MKGLTVFPSHQNLSMLLAYQSPCRPRQNLLPFLKCITEIHQNKRSLYRKQHIFNWKILEPSISFFFLTDLKLTPYVFRIARCPLHRTKIPTTENWTPIDLIKPFPYLLLHKRRLVLSMDVPNQF